MTRSKQRRRSDDASRGRSRRDWALPVAVAAAALVVLVTLGASVLRARGTWEAGATTLTAVLVTLTVVAMVIGFLTGARRTTGAAQRAWRWFAAGGVVYLLGELAWDVEYLTVGAPTEAAIADAFWLAAYPFFFVALYIRSRGLAGKFHRGAGLIESLIVMGLFGIVLWKLTLDSGIAADGGIAGVAVGIAYPVVDLALLWLLLRNVYGAGGVWNAERSLLATGFLALVIGDTLWALPAGHAAAAYTDVAYVTFGIALGAAGLAAAAGSREWRAPTWAQSRPLLIDLMPYAAGLAVGGFVPVWQMVTGDRDAAITFTAVAVLGLVFVRLAMAVRQNRRMRERAERAALQDALTGLWNHRYFQERLGEELARSRRAGTTVGLLMIDIDSFKLVNDTIGHLGGDRLLRDLGAALRKVSRPSDTPCRVGGDELAVIVPGVTHTTLQAVAERVLDASNKVRIASSDAVKGGYLEVSLSIGGAVFPADAGSQRELIHDADVALYRAKRDGGGRFTGHEPQLAGPASPDEELAAAERKIEARELDLRRVFSVAHDPMLILSAAGNVLDANPAACGLTGLSADQLRSRTIWDFVPEGGDNSLADAVGGEAGDELASVENDGQIALPDGTRRAIEFSVAPFPPDRHLIAMRDVTDRVSAGSVSRAG